MIGFSDSFCKLLGGKWSTSAAFGKLFLWSLVALRNYLVMAIRGLLNWQAFQKTKF
jgi:hypothetical protein